MHVTVRVLHSSAFILHVQDLHCIFLPLVPAPTAVIVTAPLGVIAGSSVTLTCSVELSSAVDVPVTVSTEWTGPADVTFMPTNPVPAVMVNVMMYINTVEVNAAKNGSYTCQATITSGGTTFGSINITVGMFLKLWNSFI